MNCVATEQSLEQENACWSGTAGVSAENRSHGFHPAFFDTRTGTVYLSRFADGRPAPLHILDGLPEELVISRTACGCMAAIRSGVISGFVFEGSFYTRTQAARAVSALTEPTDVRAPDAALWADSSIQRKQLGRVAVIHSGPDDSQHRLGLQP